MGFYESADSKIYYEVHGAGFPVLLFAPGGMHSSINRWSSAPFNLVELLKPKFSVVVMDQRNAGRSVGKINGNDGWDTYLRDQLGLMDHLGLKRFHLAGMCIGGAYALNFAKVAPSRVSSAVLIQPIGLDNNRHIFFDMFDKWACSISSRYPELDQTKWNSFRSNLFGSDFVFSVDESFVAACRTPLLVLAGNDEYHPAAVSRAIASLSPNASLIENWKDLSERRSVIHSVLKFLDV